jgi:Fe-S-cluster containining protein
LKNYLALANKVDAFFVRVSRKYADEIRCRRSCIKCCTAGISICRVEHDSIKRHIDDIGFKPKGRRSEKCTFLTDADLCAIYDHRPIVCRIWGLPFTVKKETAQDLPQCKSAKIEGGDKIALCCDLNFNKGTSLEGLPAEDILNADTVLTTLAAINHVYCRKLGLDPSERTRLDQ